MALLRTRGGGLLATGPDAVRANAMRQQQMALQAAAPPRVISAPRPILEDNPLNTIGTGLASLGKSLTATAGIRREQAARQALEAAGADPSAQLAVQRQFPDTKAGQSAGAMAGNALDMQMRRRAAELDAQRFEEQKRAQMVREANEARRIDLQAGRAETERLLGFGRLGLDRDRFKLDRKKFGLQEDEALTKTNLRRRRQEAIERAAKALRQNDMPGYRAALLESGDPDLVGKVVEIVSKQDDVPLKAREKLGEQVENFSVAGRTINEVDDLIDMIKSGDLKYNLFTITEGAIFNRFGQGRTAQSRRNALALQRLRRFQIEFVNSQLRLNKGVQTEGDAQRAFEELLDAPSNEALEAKLRGLRDRMLGYQKTARQRAQIFIGGYSGLREYSDLFNIPSATPAVPAVPAFGNPRDGT